MKTLSAFVKWLMVAMLVAAGLVTGTSTVSQAAPPETPVGAKPVQVAIAPDGTFAYVANHDSNSVSRVRTADGVVTTTIALSGQPTGVAISPDGTFAYVSGSSNPTGSASGWRITTATNQPTAFNLGGVISKAVAFAPDGSFAYLSAESPANPSAHGVLRVRTSDDTLTATIAIEQAVTRLALAPDGTFAYVLSRNPDNPLSLVRIRTSDNTVTGTTLLGYTATGNRNIAISPDGTFAYVPTSDATIRVRTSDNTVTASIPRLDGGQPASVAFAPGGAVAYVSRTSYWPEPPGYLEAIRTADNNSITTTGVGFGAADVAVAPDGSYALVINVGTTTKPGGTLSKVALPQPPPAIVTENPPTRVADTRAYPGSPPIPAVKAKLPQNGILEIPVAGPGSLADTVPADAVAANLNVTVVGAVGPGYATVFPCGTARPGVSSINYVAGQVTPNAALVGIGTDGKVCLYTSQTTDIVVDLDGWVPAGRGFNAPAAATRIADTRNYQGSPPIPAVKAKLPQNGVLEVPVGGVHGVPADASAAVLNVVAVGAAASGYLTVYPCGTTMFHSSNVNYTKDTALANATLTSLGTGGKVCIYTLVATDVVVDLDGWFTAQAGYYAQPSLREVDTRYEAGGRTLAAGEVLVAQPPVWYDVGLPERTSAIAVHVTAVNPKANGFLTVFPCGQPRPLASNVNYTAGGIASNTVISGVGPERNSVCIYTLAATDLIVDVDGWLPVTPAPG